MLWQNNANSMVLKRLWWAAAGGSIAILFLLLNHYLTLLANPWPIIGLVALGFGTRAYGILAGDMHDRAGKTVLLLALTSILAVLFAMLARPLFVEVMKVVLKVSEESTSGLGWAREYIEPFKAKVVGYIGFYAAGYFFSYKLVARLGRSINLLAYPRSKAELHAAFWEAAGQVPYVQIDAIDRQAERLLNEHKGYYGGRRPAPLMPLPQQNSQPAPTA